MSFKKNQKKYNKEVMATGRQANQYMKNALGLINQYTTNYADRTDFWTNKLNDRQLNLLSDKYLAQNANMLRGQAAFGSNSALNRQINENAYEQQNYLANVANQNVMNANQLQQNELNSLMNASTAYQNPISMGASAAQNVDAANSAWAGALGQGLQAAGTAVSFINPALGGAISTGGGLISNISTPSTDYDTNLYRNQQQNAAITQMMTGGGEGQGLAGAAKNLSTKIKNRNKVDSNFTIE